MSIEQMINPKTGKFYYYKENRDVKLRYMKSYNKALSIYKKFLKTHGLQECKNFVVELAKRLRDGFDGLEEKGTMGFVYVLTNPAWSDKVKIGRTEDLNKRLSQLNVGDPHKAYEIVFSKFFLDCEEKEKVAHGIAATLSPTQSGEWFTLAKYEAINIIKELEA